MTYQSWFSNDRNPTEVILVSLFGGGKGGRWKGGRGYVQAARGGSSDQGTKGTDGPQKARLHKANHALPNSPSNTHHHTPNSPSYTLQIDPNTRTKQKPIPYCCMAAASATYPKATPPHCTQTPRQERKGRGRENEEARGRKEGVGSR